MSDDPAEQLKAYNEQVAQLLKELDDPTSEISETMTTQIADLLSGYQSILRESFTEIDEVN